MLPTTQFVFPLIEFFFCKNIHLEFDNIMFDFLLSYYLCVVYFHYLLLYVFHIIYYVRYYYIITF